MACCLGGILHFILRVYKERGWDCCHLNRLNEALTRVFEILCSPLQTKKLGGERYEKVVHISNDRRSVLY